MLRREPVAHGHGTRAHARFVTEPAAPGAFFGDPAQNEECGVYLMLFQKIQDAPGVVLHAARIVRPFRPIHYSGEGFDLEIILHIDGKNTCGHVLIISYGSVETMP